MRPTLRRSDTPDHLVVNWMGQSFRVHLRRHPAATKMTLRLSTPNRCVTLTMPERGSLASAQRFADSHGGWIATRMAKLPEKVEFRPGAAIPFRGEMHTIHHLSPRRAPTTLGPGPSIQVNGPDDFIGKRVREFLERECLSDLKLAVAKHTANLGVPARKVTVKDTVSRWGSCTSQGELNFSWRLIMAPPFVLDYLAAHEVAHLKEMNHSNRFWRLTKELCPQTDEAERWLDRLGNSLHRYG